MKCKVDGCRFSDKHKTENHECGTWSKCEHITRTIDTDNYYPGRIIISYKEDS